MSRASCTGNQSGVRGEERGEEERRGVGCIAWLRGEAQHGATSRAVNHICTARWPHWHTATSTDMGLARQPDGSPHYTPLKANRHDKHWHNKQLVTAVGMDFTCRGPAWWWVLTSFLGQWGTLGPWFFWNIKRPYTVVTAISFLIIIKQPVIRVSQHKHRALEQHYNELFYN